MANLPQNYQQGYVPSTLQELEKISDYIVKSGLFGLEKREQAMALLLLAQSEGIHPMKAVMKYNIVQGKPAKKAEAMLGDFIQQGGKVKWHKLDNTIAEATFTAPNGDSITIKWTIEMASKITTKYYDKFEKQWKVKKLTDKDNWKNYPRAMLRSRVISEGIRTVYPQIVEGVYTPEEVIDFSTEDTTVIDITENSNSESNKTTSSENKPDEPKAKKEWTIQEIKKVIIPELKEKFSNLKLTQKTIISLFKDFNGNQEEILAHLNQNEEEIPAA